MRSWPGLAVALTIIASCVQGDEPDTPDDDDATDEPAQHVAVVGVPSSFQSTGAGGWSLDDGSELYDVGFGFYEQYDDDFDVLVVWTERDVEGLFAYSVALGWNQIQGIGAQEVYELYGWSDLGPADAGSAGALQQIVLMNSPATYKGAAWGPLDILTHEVGHRWSANLSLPSAADRWVLTDAWYAHWNVHSQVGGPSAVGYGDLLDLGGGSFEFVLSEALAYSDLELYQQGLLAPEEVGELFYVEDAHDHDPPTWAGAPWTTASYGAAVQYRGTRVEFTIDDVIAAHGPRVPPHEEAQTSYRMAFVLVCEDPSSCDEDTLRWVDEQRAAWEETFSAATRGRGAAATEL